MIPLIHEGAVMELEVPESLSDGTITIRRVSVDDTDALYEAASSSTAEIYPWLQWCRPEYTR
jgi:hypothetical protein